MNSAPAQIPDGPITGEIPASSCYVVRHTGPYAQLGNAWSAGIRHGRAKVFVQMRTPPPFEIYQSDPAKVPASELVTLVHFPAKA